MHAYVPVIDGEDDRAYGEAVKRGVFHVVAKEGSEFFVEEFLEALMPMADDRGFGARSIGEFAIAHGIFLGWRSSPSSATKAATKAAGWKRRRGQKKEA
jgi:hypothetical protein